MPELPEIAATIKSRRRRLGISQAEAARRVDVGRLQWIHWEAARVAPSDENRPKVAGLLGCSEDDLEREVSETDALTLLVRTVAEREVDRRFKKLVREYERRTGAQLQVIA